MSHAIAQPYVPIAPQAPKIQYRNIKAHGPRLDTVYKIRYESYSADDYIGNNPSGRFMDEYDAMRNCTSYLTYAGKNPIGSIRICAYQANSDDRIPIMEDYRDDISQEVGFNKSFIEVNRFVVHPAYQARLGVKARFYLYKNIIEEADRWQADCVFAAVRPEHVKFYRMVNFEPISDLKRYPYLKFKTILMACFKLEKTREFVLNITKRGVATA